MAKNNSTSKRPGLVSSALYLPALQSRVTEKQYPKHLQIGICFGDQITMHFHTAGTQAIWEIPVVDAAKNDRLIDGLSPQDALQVGLYFQKQISKSTFEFFRGEIDGLNAKLEKSELAAKGGNHG